MIEYCYLHDGGIVGSPQEFDTPPEDGNWKEYVRYSGTLPDDPGKEVRDTYDAATDKVHQVVAVSASASVYVLTTIRALRDAKLAECDWTQVPDAPVDAEAWRVYRQKLRDLPSEYPNILSIDEVVWPNPPS